MHSNTQLLLVALVAILQLGQSFEFREEESFQFEQWMAAHQKRYDSVDEYQQRFKIFRENARKIAKIQNTDPMHKGTQTLLIT